jgi:hypothetical protein
MMDEGKERVSFVTRPERPGVHPRHEEAAHGGENMFKFASYSKDMDIQTITCTYIFDCLANCETSVLLLFFCSVFAKLYTLPGFFFPILGLHRSFKFDDIIDTDCIVLCVTDVKCTASCIFVFYTQTALNSYSVI